MNIFHLSLTTSTTTSQYSSTAGYVGQYIRCIPWRVRIVCLLHQLRKGVGVGAGVDTSVKTLRAAWKSSITREVGSSSSPIIPSESESYVASMDISMVRTSMNAPLGLEYLLGHNRSRTLSQT